MPAKSANTTFLDIREMDSEKLHQVREDEANQASNEKAFEEQYRRRIARVESWARKLDKADIVELLSYAVVLLLEKKKTARATERAIEAQRKIFELQNEGFQRERIRTEVTRELAVEFHEKLVADKQARKRGAAAKLAGDKVQAAKPMARSLWLDWQSGKTKHKNGAAFHRYVVDQLPDITSTKTVERWCLKWRKEHRDAAG